MLLCSQNNIWIHKHTAWPKKTPTHTSTPSVATLEFHAAVTLAAAVILSESSHNALQDNDEGREPSVQSEQSLLSNEDARPACDIISLRSLMLRSV